MTQTSSADPFKLIRYSERAIQIDQELILQSSRLAVSLQQFEATCTEYKYRLPVVYLADEMRLYARDAEETDNWVGRIGRDFQKADESNFLISKGEIVLDSFLSVLSTGAEWLKDKTQAVWQIMDRARKGIVNEWTRRFSNALSSTAILGAIHYLVGPLSRSRSLFDLALLVGKTVGGEVARFFRKKFSIKDGEFKDEAEMVRDKIEAAFGQEGATLVSELPDSTGKVSDNQVIIYASGILTTGDDGRGQRREDWHDPKWLAALGPEGAGFAVENIYRFSYGVDYKRILEQVQTEIKNGRAPDFQTDLYQEEWGILHSTSLAFEEQREQYAAFVQLIQLQRGEEIDITLTGHSKGGLLAAGAYSHLPEEIQSQVTNVITFGSPHDGGLLGGIAGSVLGDQVSNFFSYFGMSLTESDLLTEPNENVDFTVVAGDDELVLGQSSLKFEGIDEMYLIDSMVNSQFFSKKGYFWAELPSWSSGHDELSNTEGVAQVINNKVNQNQRA